MEKVEKRSLNQSTPQQIAELEEILDRCSKCAIEEFSEEDTGCWSDFELDEQTVDRLEECFEKSGLFLKQSVDIADAFVHSVFPLTDAPGWWISLTKEIRWIEVLIPRKGFLFRNCGICWHPPEWWLKYRFAFTSTKIHQT